MAGEGNMNAHVATYDRVIAMLKWGTVACAIIAIAVVLVIAR